MFWRVSGLNTASPVDAILDKETYTLNELLDEDELIQECKSLNARLIGFLKQKESVEQLLEYLIEEPSEDADARRQFKYPFSACEIFCCEVESIFNTLLESDELMDRLFSILSRPRPLNSMLAGYFARVVSSLLLRRSSDVMQWMQRRESVLGALVDHIDTTSVAEVLVRVVGADDPRSYPVATAMQWLANTDLPQRLAEQLAPGAPTEAQANAAEVLAAVARSSSSPLTRCLAGPDFMGRLVESALAPHEDRAATHALNVCIALLEPPPETQMPHSPSTGQLQGSMVSEVHNSLRAEAIRRMSESVDQLVAILNKNSDAELRTSFGLVRSPVGPLRLKAVELLAALLRTGDPGAEAAVMDTQGVQRAMELFLTYPFNNALHSAVTHLLTSFEPGSDTLREFLITEAGLVDWLVQIPEQVTPERNPDDTTDVERKPLRAGYAGHVTQMSNRLLNIAEHSELVRDLLAKHGGWQSFVADRLEPRNKLESVFAWQCGRPATHGGELMDSDINAFTGGMDYNSMEGAFSRDVYQRYGVYEDDDDDDDGQEAAEWAMNLSQVVDPGKLHPIPDITFADSSGSDEDESEEGSEGGSTGDGEGSPPVHSDLPPVHAPSGLTGYDPDLVVVSSPPAGDGDNENDENADDLVGQNDDAVVLDDYEAAEGLVDLQEQMANRLVLGENDENGAAGEEQQQVQEGSPENQEYLANQYWKQPMGTVDDDNNSNTSSVSVDNGDKAPHEEEK